MRGNSKGNREASDERGPASFATGGFLAHHNAAGGDDFDAGLAIERDQAGRLFVAGWSWGGGFPEDDMAIWLLK